MMKKKKTILKIIVLDDLNKTTMHNNYSKCGLKCSLKHLKSLHTFPEKSGQVVLADS